MRVQSTIRWEDLHLTEWDVRRRETSTNYCESVWWPSRADRKPLQAWNLGLHVSTKKAPIGDAMVEGYDNIWKIFSCAAVRIFRVVEKLKNTGALCVYGFYHQRLG